MNNRTIFFAVVLILLGISFIVYNQKQQSENEWSTASITQTLEDKTQEAAKLAKETAAQAAKVAEQAKQEAKAKAEELAKQEAEAKAKAEELAKQAEEQKTQELAAQKESLIRELIAKAKALLASGKYDEAITIAQQVIAQSGGNSPEANSILETAKAGMQKAATQKLEDLKSTNSGSAVDSVKGALGGIGQ